LEIAVFADVGKGFTQLSSTSQKIGRRKRQDVTTVRTRAERDCSGIDRAAHIQGKQQRKNENKWKHWS